MIWVGSVLLAVSLVFTQALAANKEPEIKLINIEFLELSCSGDELNLSLEMAPDFFNIESGKPKKDKTESFVITSSSLVEIERCLNSNFKTKFTLNSLDHNFYIELALELDDSHTKVIIKSGEDKGKEMLCSVIDYRCEVQPRQISSFF